MTAHAHDVVTAQTVVLGMPLSFVAFCQPRRELYQRYATVRTGNPLRARHLVEAVLGDLAMAWPDILSGPSPAAASWELLTIRTARVCRRSSTYQLLGTRQADAVVLCYRLGLPAHVAADLMGIDEPGLTRTLRGVLDEFR